MTPYRHIGSHGSFGVSVYRNPRAQDARPTSPIQSEIRPALRMAVSADFSVTLACSAPARASSRCSLWPKVTQRSLSDGSRSTMSLVLPMPSSCLRWVWTPNASYLWILICSLTLERRFAPSTSREEDVGCLEFRRLLGRGQFQYQHVRYTLLSDPFLIRIPVLVSWMIASSMVTLGLSPWQAWGCVWIGYTLVAPFIVLNARPGAILHVTFPVVARMSFGIWGSLWCVFNRAAMAWWVPSSVV